MLTKAIQYSVAIVLSIAITLPVISRAVSIRPQSKVFQWNGYAEFNVSSYMRHVLLQRDYVDGSVALEDLDHIFVLVQQLTAVYFPNVDPVLVLAVISVESGFRSDVKSPAGAIGLMQVMPKWHYNRLEPYLDHPITEKEGTVLLEEPYYNLLAGVSYLSELLDTTEGDLTYSLMWYNGGYNYARRHYVLEGRTSVYASEVIERAEYISSMLEKGGATYDDLRGIRMLPY